jgi:ABC-type bacteriocin/lantibiotic exporter with double-glycine peptidase domain
LKTEDPTPSSDLAAILVRISRECDATVEHLRAEQLIRDAREAWPGDEAERWSKWLGEACRSLNLMVREAELPIDGAKRLAEDGASVVGAWRPDRGLLLLVDGAESAEGEIDQRRGMTAAELNQVVGAAVHPTRWLVVEHAERIDGAHDPRLAHRPVRRFWQILRPEWNDIWIILVFAFFVGLLSLSTPIAVESLVNTVAFGRLIQPVVVLALLLFGFLSFAAVLQAVQTFVAEVIQRRLFARVAADLAHRLPRVDLSKLDGEYGPELVNRFLDITTLQKVSAQLLLEGVSLVLAALVGMTVLSFYHPWLLGFSVLLLCIVIGGLFFLGRGAIRTGIDESKLKYYTTAWFEDLIRCRSAFKPAGGAEFAVDRANLLTSKYLKYRRAHFGILYRQIVFVLGLQAVAGTILLGGGGWLVIQGQLSLGQLVAAELIVSTILGSLAKVGKHLEGFYDVVAAVDKLGHLFDLPLERCDGLLAIEATDGGLPIALSNVRVAGARGLLSEGLSLRIDAGDRVAVVGPSKSGKSALCEILYGGDQPAGGRVSISGVDPGDIRPDVLRAHVTLIGDIEIFEGTIAENVHLRRRQVGTTECRAALEAVGLLDDCLALQAGLDTQLSPTGFPLSSGQSRLLMLARAIAASPQLILLDGAVDGLADRQLERAMTALVGPHRKWTLIVATGRRDVAVWLDRVVELVATEPVSGGVPAGVSRSEA